MDRLTAMQVFVDVARSGSFTRSAERLDMSRAMATRYVVEMEQWLGTGLLRRTTRRVSLTDAGEQAVRRCEQILALSQEVQDEVVSQDGQLRGQLRLTASISFAHAHLVDAVSAFMERYPLLNIDLNVGEHAQDLVDERIDLAIRISNDPTPSLIARPLATCASVLVASPAYLAAHGIPQAPQDLKQHRCLGHANFGRSTWRLTRGDETQEVQVTTRLTANETTVLLRGAANGAGIGFQPTYLAAPLIASGELQTVLPDWQPQALTINALYTSRRSLSAAARVFLDFLVGYFAVARW